ncbi:MAG: hypothetical protein KBD05_00715 [Candidatus Pacebacteria bacterium]|nr:hypothetical protein [Candidatus Paceibacterota bacterium]
MPTNEPKKTHDEVIQEAWDRAPSYVRETLTSAEFQNFLKSLEVRFKIPADIAGAAAYEIYLALLGITKPKELPVYLEVDARVPNSAMDALVTALDAEVFAPLLEKAGVTKQPKAKADLPEPPPINRLSKTPLPKDLPSPATPKVSPTPAVVPPAAPAVPAPSLAEVKIPVPKPFGTDIAAPLIKSVTPPPAPPVVAEPPLVPVKKRPGETGVSLPPKSASAGTKLDPYREAPE